MDALSLLPRYGLAFVLALACACGGGDSTPTGGAPASPEAEGEVVTPPFRVTGDCDGLFLYYVDAEGVHAVERRADVPEGQRDRVRVESPRLAPEDRDPDSVYIADLRQPGSDGSYVVRRLPRDAFDAWVDRATGHEEDEQVAAADAPVIIYGASWCGVCRSLEAYLDSIGVPHIDKDIEQDADARAEMQRKARAAGVQTTGIPVVDIDGTILQGFDRSRVDQLLARRHAGTAPGAPAAPAAPSAPSAPAPAPGTIPI